MVTLSAHRVALGRLFQSFGAAHVNERSPRVVQLLNAGCLNKRVSVLDFRLYLPGVFSSMSQVLISTGAQGHLQFYIQAIKS